MVFRAQEVSHLPGSNQVWRALDPHAEGVQLVLPVKGVGGVLQVPAMPVLTVGECSQERIHASRSESWQVLPDTFPQCWLRHNPMPQHTEYIFPLMPNRLSHATVCNLPCTA